MAAVRTPLDSVPALALGNRRYRKQLLKTGPLHYQGGVVDISAEMIGGIVQAFDAKAQTKVPFQLADANNAHTMDPLRRKGFVTALHQTSDGLDGIIELEDEAAGLVDSDPEFGVSVLVSPITTGEGQSYDHVLQHVLGTYSPVITSLEPWSIAASQTPADGLVDFLALAAEDAENKAEPATDAPQDDDAPAPTDSATSSPSSDEGVTDPSEEEPAVPSLKDMLADASADDLKALRAKLDEVDPPKPAEGDDDEPTDDAATDESTDDADDDSAPSDEEIEAMLTTADDLETESPEQVAASHAAGESDNAIALANMSSQLEEMRLANEVTSKKLAEAEWKTEKDAWIHANIPPHILGLCEPFLNGASKTLALSNGGDKERVAGQLRKVLTEISKQAPNLGLSQGQIGTSEEADQAREEAEARAAKAARVTAHIK